ncbi:hypothetical protein AB2L28_13600 [Kineococcus sp. TBRC 1896]|uniref:Uncharacterized protein n=1 Tax=Kineococcus mangrovi TaxID=1660183 RepID=A0ABV4I5I4_9ACTN
MRMTSRPWSARILLLGCAAIAVGILLLFHPTTTTYEGAQLDCGSAISPSSAAVAGYDCSVDERRFTAVSIMTSGAFVALVAGLWPALRGGERVQSVPDASPSRH